MNKDIVANASITVNAPRAKVWDALVNPEIIKQYMFGTEVISDWKKGSPIVWKGEWKGKPYEDKGEILEIEAGEVLQYTHFSPMEGQPDVPANYHTISISLIEEDNGTLVSLSQDNNVSEKASDESQKMWETMLDGLKKAVE